MDSSQNTILTNLLNPDITHMYHVTLDLFTDPGKCVSGGGSSAVVLHGTQTSNPLTFCIPLATFEVHVLNKSPVIFLIRQAVKSLL